MRDKLFKLLCHNPCPSPYSCHDCEGFGHEKICLRIRTKLLADYLIANGVIIPPCPVGTTVYVVGQFLCDADGYGMNFSREWDIRVRAFTLDMMDKVGVSVFLDRKEAEAELERKMYER